MRVLLSTYGVVRTDGATVAAALLVDAFSRSELGV
jgi:hypothetical protein